MKASEKQVILSALLADTAANGAEVPMLPVPYEKAPYEREGKLDRKARLKRQKRRAMKKRSRR